MAVTQIPIVVNHYIGLSTDTKPTSVPIGSTFFESDSGDTYICTDGSTWVVYDNSTVS